MLRRRFVVRAGSEGEDYKSECAAMRELLARHPEWPVSLSLSLAGVEAMTSEHRGEYEDRLHHRLQEYDLAVASGWQAAADAADTNVVAALVKLNRLEEALARVRLILDRLADKSSRNAAYAWNALLGILVVLGRSDEFRAAASRAAPVMRKNNLCSVTEHYARILALEGRVHDAARMVGHVHSAYQASGRMVEPITLRGLQRVERKVRESVDEATFAACVAEGRHLDDVAVDRLLLGPKDATAIAGGANGS